MTLLIHYISTQRRIGCMECSSDLDDDDNDNDNEESIAVLSRKPREEEVNRHESKESRGCVLRLVRNVLIRETHILKHLLNEGHV